MNPLVPGVLAALAVWVWFGAGARSVRDVRHLLRANPNPGVGLRGELGPGLAGPAGMVTARDPQASDSQASRSWVPRGLGPARWVRAVQGGRRTSGDPDLAALTVAHVGALLRGGASPAQAWERGAKVATDNGVPDVAQLARRVGSAATAQALVAACRLAADVGAPLVGVLEQVAATISAEAEARAEREAALAGPRATTRVLMWLPVAGLGLGMLLGVDPIATALGGGLGTVGLLLGVICLAAGRTWSARMVAAARAEGEGM